ncbi:MAG: hypothetical protein J1D88_05090 [Treponema sp.]|nr:hypothetical protein [Treponema sp.]
MKGIKNYLFMMALVAALFGFAACSNDSDDEPSAVAVFTTVDGKGVLTCYDNGSFNVVIDGYGTTARGTYEGNPRQDGKVTFKYTYFAGVYGSAGTAETFNIVNGSFTGPDGNTYTRKDG